MYCAGQKDAESHTGSQPRQQHGAPDRTGRPPVHERRSELEQESFQPQVNVDIRGLVERGHQDDGEIVRGAKQHVFHARRRRPRLHHRPAAATRAGAECSEPDQVDLRAHTRYIH